MGFLIHKIIRISSGSQDPQHQISGCDNMYCDARDSIHLYQKVLAGGVPKTEMDAE